MRTAAVCCAVMLTAPLCACIGLHSNQPVQQQYLLSLPPQPAGAPAGNAAGVAAGEGAGAGNAAGEGEGAGVAAGTRAAPSAAAAAAAVTLEVLPPLAAPGLASDGIAVLRPGQRLDYYTGARWAVPAPMMLQTLAIEALRREGRFSLVEPDSGPFGAHYLLNLELTHFEADYGGAGTGASAPTVHVTLVGTLGVRVGRSVVTTLTINSSVEADADRMSAIIAAFQQATDAALGRMAREIVPTSTAAVPAAAAPAAPDPAAPASETP